MTEHINKMYCGAIARGDIVVFENDLGDIQNALVLQDNILNEGLPTIVCAGLKDVGEDKTAFANEVLITKGEHLNRDVLCLLHKIFTLERKRIRDVAGSVDGEVLKKVFRALDINLGRFRDNILFTFDA